MDKGFTIEFIIDGRDVTTTIRKEGQEDFVERYQIPAALNPDSHEGGKWAWEQAFYVYRGAVAFWRGKPARDSLHFTRSG